MSQIVSPSTGRLITVGSDEFEQLIHSPVWKSHFTSPLTAVPLGTVKPSNGLSPISNTFNQQYMQTNTGPRSPYGQLPPLPIISSVPISSPISPMSSINSYNRILPPVPKSPTLLNNNYNRILPPVPKSPTSPILSNYNRTLPPCLLYTSPSPRDRS